MNYIKQLQEENQQLKEQAAAAQELITAFRAHLTTPKFWEDTTIQIGDVESRLLEIQAALRANSL